MQHHDLVAQIYELIGLSVLNCRSAYRASGRLAFILVSLASIRIVNVSFAFNCPSQKSPSFV